ncbi:hypothetical protein SLEP1_g51117 [Rubroshorea leprosula]|uniref:Uncharacterized protein n=1 Tax=Rubroshorea leprosula TaxID=152421 RepID=A0AAV5M5E3_9ROSI|nr:hypothetical protein SLEP1_g51117 [Rubroshorea leprosula]
MRTEEGLLVWCNYIGAVCGNSNKKLYLYVDPVDRREEKMSERPMAYSFELQK